MPRDEPTRELAQEPKITYGIRDDGSMWLSIGSPESGPHCQGDWYFGKKRAAQFAAAPALLDACRAMIAAVELHGADSEDFFEARNQALEAIAKAVSHV